MGTKKAPDASSWLRLQAEERISQAASRRSSAKAYQNDDPEDRKAGHLLCEKMMGRKIPRKTLAQEAESASIQLRIALKLETEAEMLNCFAAEFDALKAEKSDHDKSFDLRWAADMRAIKRWQKHHPGNDLVWPDHADLCVWLLGQLER